MPLSKFLEHLQTLSSLHTINCLTGFNLSVSHVGLQSPWKGGGLGSTSAMPGPIHVCEMDAYVCARNERRRTEDHFPLQYKLLVGFWAFYYLTEPCIQNHTWYITGIQLIADEKMNQDKTFSV